ncbi:hypothetical protein D049_4202A, partial [Vibrio parahaemolyticus VPTS-2010]
MRLVEVSYTLLVITR